MKGTDGDEASQSGDDYVTRHRFAWAQYNFAQRGNIIRHFFRATSVTFVKFRRLIVCRVTTRPATIHLQCHSRHP